MKPKNYAKTKWEKLTASFKSERLSALQVLNEMRKGKTLTHSCKELGTSARIVKKHLGKFIRKKGRRWVASKSDKIQRGMTIYSRGKIKSIIVISSKDASIIGQYFNAVRKFLDTRDSRELKLFKKVTIIDSEGKKHKLETNPDKILAIEEQKESPELFEIYDEVDG